MGKRNLAALLLGCCMTFSAMATTLQIANQTIDPLEIQNARATPLLNGAGEGFYLVQFHQSVRQQDLNTLSTAQQTLLQPYPGNAYLVWGHEQDQVGLRALDTVRASMPMPLFLKKAPNLHKFAGVTQLAVHFFAADIEQTLASLANRGANILRHYKAQPDGKFYDVILELDAAKVDDIALIPEVLWVTYSSPEPGFEDEMSNQIIADRTTDGVPQTGYLMTLSNLGYDGSGVVWSVIDSGVDYAHPDLVNQIVGGYTYPGTGTTNPGDDTAGGGHGTHVAGIIAGDASNGAMDADGFLYGLGVAPGAGIFAQNPLSGNSWPPAGGWEELSKRGVAGNATGANNSWTTGEGTQHGYQNSERTFDFIVRDGDFDTAGVAEAFVMIFSAGNSDFNGLTAPKEAKNVVVTASTNNYRIGDIDGVSDFSSRGPAVDGRWVPTIAAPGGQIASAQRQGGASQCTSDVPGTSGIYSFCSGTSMAAPHTSGVAAIITEWYRDISSTRGPVADPSPALIKALLINGAVDMGPSDIPNIHEGFGRISIPRSIGDGENLFFLEQDSSSRLFDNAAETHEYLFTTADDQQPAILTLVWTDAPGAVGANPALVNDLDLVVENGGNTYFGNNFTDGVSQPGGTADRLNNIEHIVIENPGNTLEVSITAFAVPGDGVPLLGDATDQDYVLVCRNCVEENGVALNVTPGSQSVCQPDDAIFEVNVVGAAGVSDSATLSATQLPAGSMATFAANPVDTGNNTTVTISDTNLASAGSHTVEVSGTWTSGVAVDDATLDIFAAAPSVTTLTSPVDGDGAASLTPTFMWTAIANAQTYTLEVAEDMAFSNIVISEQIDAAQTSYTPTTDLDSSTEYYWRVRSSNACGDSSDSGVFSFITQPLPGDCPLGQTQVHAHGSKFGFESGAAGWTTGGTGSTWALSTSNPHSGSQHWHADNVGSETDQQLTSPPIYLHPDYSPYTLQFWNFQEMEARSGGGCWDGGLLEVSIDGGNNWTQVPNGDLATDPYDGAIQNGFDNPLAGMDAWCGNVQPYLNSVVDINQHTGETIQLRFRMGTDRTVAEPGWDIDDVAVMGCGVDAMFDDSFSVPDA